MPWKRRRICGSGPTRVVYCAVAAALAAGLLACVIGAALHFGVSTLSDKYSQYKRISSSYTPEQLEKAKEKFKKAGW